jgi:ferredoxin
MTYIITEACLDVKDQSCIEVCPVDCIFGEEEDRMCYIHPVDCIDCAACELACPVGAIFTLEKLPSDSAAFTEINAIWFEDKNEARRRADKAG